jgi:hypothetical protein
MQSFTEKDISKKVNKIKMKYIALIIAMILVMMSCVSAQVDLWQAVEKAIPSVFLVKTYDSNGKTLNLGTGFFVELTGELVTNWHVMKGASSAIVSQGEKTYRALRILAIDVNSDLALLQMEKEVEGIPLREDLPRVGESVIAIGSPLGYENTVSTGIVSAVRTNGNRTTIQITAPISPGSSGSPVIDIYGRVIGVANSTAVRGQNINFVIPSKEVIEMMQAAGTGGISGSIKAYNGDPVKNITVYLANKTIKDLWDAESAGLLAEGEKTAFLQYNTEQMNEYTGAISGQLLDAAGNPISGTIRMNGITETTDMQGSFVISGLFPGEYTLKAERGGALAEERVVIKAGTNVSVFPVIPEVVEIKAPENLSYFLLKNIPHGEYSVFARGELENGTVLTGHSLNISVYSNTKSTNITLYPAKPVSMDLSFKDEDKVIVTLRDAHGQPVGNGYEVKLFTTSGKITPEKAFTDKEGRAFAVLSDSKGATVTAVYIDPTTWTTIYDIKVKQ